MSFTGLVLYQLLIVYAFGKVLSAFAWNTLNYYKYLANLIFSIRSVSYETRIFPRDLWPKRQDKSQNIFGNTKSFKF